MGSATLIIFSLLLVVMLSSSVIHCEQAGGRRIIPPKRHSENYLMRLRKSAVKTIKTIVGDTYDCVDIRKQPGFDPTLLQDREIQMAASSQRIIENLITVDCPKGTVPFRRIGKKDLARAELFAESYSSNLTSITDDSPGRHFTVAMPKDNSKDPYWGIGAQLSLHGFQFPPSSQATFGQMWIERGDSSIRTGWTVNPMINRDDSSTRLFVYFKTKESPKYCWNWHCTPGFVQVHPTVPVDVVFNKTSEYSGRQYTVTLRIEFSENGWWLVYENYVRIGYWPIGVLPDMDRLGADIFAFGGVASGDPEKPGPPMGSGHFETRFLYRVAHMKGMAVRDHTGIWVNPFRATEMQRVGENNDCYRLDYWDYGALADADPAFLAWTLVYGGPGGNCQH